MPSPPREVSAVRTTVFIDRELLARFRRFYPQHGAMVWFVETAMRELLKQTEGDPSAQQRIEQAIRDLFRERRHNPHIRVAS